MNYNLVAIVPMRHSSERVDGKNYRPFSGKPLFFHIISTLLSCPKIDKVIIDTDSPLIKQLAFKEFPDVMILDRPRHLTDGSIPMNEILLNIIEQVDSTFYLQTHCTNPLLSHTTIHSGIQTFLSNYPAHDSLFTVTRRHIRLWNDRSQPVNHDPKILLRTQDLPPVYEENSCMYLFEKNIFKETRNRIGRHPYLFEIPDAEAQDIDTETNFQVAEILYKINTGQSK